MTYLAICGFFWFWCTLFWGVNDPQPEPYSALALGFMSSTFLTSIIYLVSAGSL